MSDSLQNNQQGEMLRRDYEEIKSHKLRRDVRLAENEQNVLTNDLREYHTVESSQDETRRIENLLLNADVLDLRESEKTDLKFRIRQNKNFELVNTEKTGGDSHFMKAVKDSVKEIDILMRKKAGSAFERHQLLEETRSKVQTGINNCVEYLKRGKPFWPWHKARYNAVEETMQRLTEDMTRLSFALEMDQANDQEGVYDAADTVLDILNSDLLEERRGAEPVGVHHAIRAEMQRRLNGIGGFEYEKDAFRHDIKQAIGTSTVKFEVDRTTATVALFMASKKGVLQDKNQCKDIYKNLAIKIDVEGAQEPTLEDKQKKVDALEEFFDMLLAFDVKNLDGMDYSTFFSSEKFKQNHMIIRAGWDADVFIKEYKKLLTNNQGLRMKYTAEEFSEVEAKRNMLSVLSNLYDAIIAYYDEPSLWDVSLDDIMGYDNDTLMAKYLGVMGAEQKNDNVIRFYSCMYNFRFNEDANTSVVVRNYNITKSAEQLLQAEREIYVAPSKLQAERERDQKDFREMMKGVYDRERGLVETKDLEYQKQQQKERKEEKKRLKKLEEEKLEQESLEQFEKERQKQLERENEEKERLRMFEEDPEELERLKKLEEERLEQLEKERQEQERLEKEYRERDSKEYREMLANASKSEKEKILSEAKASFQERKARALKARDEKQLKRMLAETSKAEKERVIKGRKVKALRVRDDREFRRMMRGALKTDKAKTLSDEKAELKERREQHEREKKVNRFHKKVDALEKELSGYDRKLYKEFFDDITGPVDDLCNIVREFFEIDDETVLNGLLQAGYDNLLLFVKSIDFGKISAFDLDYAKQELLTFAKSEYLRHEEQLKEEEARKKAEEEKTSEQREQDYINSQIFKKRVESVNEDWDPTGVREKKEEGEKKKEWTADEKQTIELLGELTFTTNVTDNRGLAVDSKQRTRGVLLNNTGILIKLLNSDATDQLRGITNYLTKSEGELLRSIGEVLGDVVEEMKKYHQGSWAPADVTECLKSPEMAKFLEKQDGEIEAALNAGAVRIEKYLDQITESALEGSEDEDLGTLFGEKVEKKESGKMKLDRLKDEAYSKNSANGKFLQKAIKDYYKYATVEEKRFMMSYLIKDLKVATSGRDFERKRAGSYYASLMKGAGPVMQKILQGIPEKMISTELSDTLSVVKSSLRPISDKYVDSVLAKMAKGDVKRVRKIRSLGAASIAETFLCELETKKGAKKQVVVKILRPDAKLHIDNEAKFLVKLARDADPSGVMKKSIENHISKVREELDFSIEVQNAIKGAAYNSVDKKEKAKVKSVNINTDVPYGKEYLVMDKAEGETLDRYISKLNQEFREVKKTFTYFDAKKKKNVNGYTPDNLGKFAEFREKLQLSIVQAEKRKNHVYLLTQKWIEKALFGNFFHHGDLHSGNIMISDDCATILDYGNATQFEDDEITPITKMAAGAAISNTDFFVDPMIGLLQKEGIKVTEAQKKAVKERVSEIMKSGGEELTGKKIFVSLLAAQECGITIPRAMNNFSLCEQRLENALDELNGIIISMKQLELQMGELDPIKGMRKEDPLIQYTDDSYTNTQKRIKEESATKDKPVAEKDKSIADEKVVELTMEKYGYTDESVMAAHIAAGDKEATDTVKLVQNVAKYYQEHKAFFDSMKKNKAAWMQELKHILALKYDDKVDGATFDVERDKLMDKTAVLMENEAADYLEILGVTNIYDHFEASFIQGNVATAEWLLGLFDERLDMMLAAANDYSIYDTNRQKTFIRASTVEKSRVQAVKSLTEVRNPLKRETGPVRKMFSELRRECIGFDDYKNVKATIKSYAQVNSKEGVAFKNAYDEFLAVESSHAKKKADDSLSSKDIIEYDTAVAKLEKAYEEVTRSELLRLKETAKYRKKTVIKDFNDIIGTEVMSHKLKLAYRLGKDFLSLLSPEAKKEVEAELKKEQKK